MTAGVLSGRVALMTGVTGTIGRELAVALAAAGADVAGVGRDRAKLLEVGRSIESHSVGFIAVQADLSVADFAAAVVTAVLKWRTRIDILVNAAGIINRAEAPELSPGEWDEVFAVNCRAPYFLSQEVGRHMLEGEGGAIINVASLAAHAVTRATTVYSASKAALVQMTRVLAVRWAPKVRVNAIGPGYILTDLNRDWFGVPGNEQYVRERTPFARVGRPADLAGSVVFLASDSASFITGQHLLVDGGWSAQ